MTMTRQMRNLLREIDGSDRQAERYYAGADLLETLVESEFDVIDEEVRRLRRMAAEMVDDAEDRRERLLDLGFEPDMVDA